MEPEGTRPAGPPLELWGGIECTVNRVHDRYFSQLESGGHLHRIGDLDLIARLGIRKLRYPMLWELQSDPSRPDWSWAGERLQKLAELGIEPIVGLVHHGSGPSYTNLLDPSFPTGLARYAAAFASRFPAVECYTPVNEPLTTARFSGLYGVWYPHRRDDASFIRALLHQCRATVLAMRAIRRVNPAALLIQTDDLGLTTSTPLLQYQADLECERRWLSWDLLCGRVDCHHPLRDFLLRSGATGKELDEFVRDPCPPDLIGVNHYLTSDRHLDENLHSYPERYWGGNGRHRYADIEAVRIRAEPGERVRELLCETWERYRIPVAITEAHLGCSREEQMRWLLEVWTGAQAARESGAQVRAVTAWALFGSHDWNSLVTERRGYYEAGAFDVRGPQPRPTALGRFVRELASNASHEHQALLDEPGWWRRDDRLFANVGKASLRSKRLRQSSPLVIAGAGMLGRAFARVCELRGIHYRLCTRSDLDICDPVSIEAMTGAHRPWAVVNAAGCADIDRAERDPSKCYRDNSEGPLMLAMACAGADIPLLSFSSDLVFDGESGHPYAESAAVAPLNVFGRSKARAEAAVLATYPEALIIRTSTLFSPWDSHTSLGGMLKGLAAGREVSAMDDVTVSPTYVPDLVHTSLDLLIDREAGLWHLVNEGTSSWAELVSESAQRAGVDTGLLYRTSWRNLGLAARRPAYSALTSERGILLPGLNDALDRFVSEALIH